MTAVLQLNGIHKHYKHIQAVRDLSMTLDQGDIYGFLGQNGAGKTTVLRMVMGLIRPTRGEIKLFGDRVKPGSIHFYQKIGSIIEFPGYYPNLTAVENLDIHRRLMGIAGRDSLEESLQTVGLWESRNRKAHEFSLGMKQRLGIARAILHRPELLILDEPTNGLDPVGIKEIRQLILELARNRNITILVSSHILSEVEQLANKVGIIHQGVLLEETYLTSLQDRNKQYLELKVDQPLKAMELLAGELKLIDCRDELGADGTGAGVLRVYDMPLDAGRINRILVNGGVEVTSLVEKKDSLEDYFVRLIGGMPNG